MCTVKGLLKSIKHLAAAGETLTMEALIKSEVRRLQRSIATLTYRRINWRVETRHRIRQKFEQLATCARDTNYPFRLSVQEFEQPTESTIQISAGNNPTGAVNRKTEVDVCAGLKHIDTLVMESGGTLIASQSVSGYVHFVVYPYSSDRIQPKHKEIMLLRSFDPTEVTWSVLNKVIKRYLLCVRSSSVYGMSGDFTWRERALLVWIRVQDIRFRYRIAKSLMSLQNEWGKAIVTGLAALLVGYLAGGNK